MLSLEQWEQTAVFNPADPTQKKIEKYAGIPGQYASYYFNKVPVTGQLKGPFTDGITTGMGLWVGVLLTSAIVGAGAWAAHKTGLIKFKRGTKPMAGLGWGGYKRRRGR